MSRGFVWWNQKDFSFSKLTIFLRIRTKLWSSTHFALFTTMFHFFLLQISQLKLFKQLNRKVIVIEAVKVRKFRFFGGVFLIMNNRLNWTQKSRDFHLQPAFGTNRLWNINSCFIRRSAKSCVGKNLFLMFCAIFAHSFHLDAVFFAISLNFLLFSSAK